MPCSNSPGKLIKKKKKITECPVFIFKTKTKTVLTKGLFKMQVGVGRKSRERKEYNSRGRDGVCYYLKKMY